MTDKEILLKEYKKNIDIAKDNLRYYYSEIKQLNRIINKNQLMINALENYQLPISFL